MKKEDESRQYFLMKELCFISWSSNLIVTMRHDFQACSINTSIIYYYLLNWSLWRTLSIKLKSTTGVARTSSCLPQILAPLCGSAAFSPNPTRTPRKKRSSRPHPICLPSPWISAALVLQPSHPAGGAAALARPPSLGAVR